MDLTTEHAAAPKTHSLTARVLDPSRETTSTSSPGLTFAPTTTSRKAVERLSQVLTPVSDQITTSIDHTHSDVPREILVGSSRMASADLHESTPVPPFQPVILPILGRPHTPQFQTFRQRAISNNNKRRADSLSSSNITLPNKRRVFDSSEDVDRLGTVSNPVLLPLQYNTPISKLIPNDEVQPVPPSKDRKEEYTYRGINSLVDKNGHPQPFPAQALTEIAYQQKKSFGTGVFSPNVYDESFATSTINDGRGKIGQRGFSSTGVRDRERPMVIGEQIQAAGEATELPLRCKDGYTRATDVSLDAADAKSEERMVDADLAALPFPVTDDEPAPSLVVQMTKSMSGTERVFGTCELLERILLKCGEMQGHGTLLEAQGVNKTFEKVVRRSIQLRQMLLSERKRRGRILV